MCHSKSEGGARCESHAKVAIADHKIAYSELVQQECMANGIMIDPTYYKLTPEDEERVSKQLTSDPAVHKATSASRKTTEQLKQLHSSLTEALGSGDIDKFTALIRNSDPELQALVENNDARKTKFAARMAAATDENAKTKAIENNKMDVAILKARKARFLAASEQQALESFATYRNTGSSKRAIVPLPCLQEVNRENIDTKETARAKIVAARTRLEKIALAERMQNDPGFQDAESSPAFRNSPAFQKWDEKNKMLQESYRLTSGYQKKLAASISTHKANGIDTAKAETAYKALTVQKAKFEYNNIAEFHGASSPQAAAALEHFNETKQKEHSFQ